MPLRRALALQDIVLDARVRSVGALVALVAERAARGDAALRERILRRLWARGPRRPLVPGGGLALPHAAVMGMPRPRAVFVRLRDPLPLGDAGRDPVDAVLALLVPSPAFQSDYDVLMQFTDLLRRPAMARQLEEAAEAPAVQRLFAGAGVPA